MQRRSSRIDGGQIEGWDGSAIPRWLRKTPATPSNLPAINGGCGHSAVERRIHRRCPDRHSFDDLRRQPLWRPSVRRIRLSRCPGPIIAPRSQLTPNHCTSIPESVDDSQPADGHGERMKARAWPPGDPDSQVSAPPPPAKHFPVKCGRPSKGGARFASVPLIGAGPLRWQTLEGSP